MTALAPVPTPVPGKPPLNRRRHRLLCAVFIAVFVVHALNYAYFFVDDEAIPFIYAQNMMGGEGLVYNPDDGPVEGYSDFLSIWIDFFILALARQVGVGKLWALTLAEMFAFACAIALVGVTFHILRWRTGEDRVPLTAGMAFLVLAGPLAVWSSTALETTLFALLTALLVLGLLKCGHSNARVNALLLFSLIAMLLCRIDGFVWVGALMLPFLIAAPTVNRREILIRVVMPALAVFLAYHAWRVWYFNEFLPMPVYTKVLYKIWSPGVLVSKDPREPYVFAFLRAYRGLPLVALGLGFAGVYQRSSAIRSLAAGIVLVTAYLSVVGDWMFGFRFFVPLLAPIAIVVAAGFDGLRKWRPRVALIAAFIWIVALGGVAFDFWGAYKHVERRDSWLAHPSVDASRFFAPFYQNYLTARAYARPGDTIAYNQAGFVPFMLDVHNVDDLGICTKFYARLPTTDVVFTEVGRYTPLTARPVLRAGESYTLSRAPRLLMESTGDLQSANRGTVPKRVLGGRYALRFSNRSVTGYTAVGQVRPLPAHLYLENLAHISHLGRASINGRQLDASEYRRELRYLYDRPAGLTFQDRYTADFTFSETALDVFELYLGGVRSPDAATLEVILKDHDGGAVYRNSFELAAGDRRDFHLTFDEGLKAVALSMAVVPHARGPHTFYVDDVRVQGQTPALKRFLQRTFKEHSMG